MGKGVEVVVDPLDLSKETLDMILGSMPEKEEDRLPYLIDNLELYDDMSGTVASCLEGLLSEKGFCFKCTKEFFFFELQSDFDGFPTCPTCLASDDVSRLDSLCLAAGGVSRLDSLCLAAGDAPRLDPLEGNACSKCGEDMPGIGSVAKVMCARCRMV